MVVKSLYFERFPHVRNIYVVAFSEGQTYKSTIFTRSREQTLNFQVQFQNMTENSEIFMRIANGRNRDILMTHFKFENILKQANQNIVTVPITFGDRSCKGRFELEFRIGH